MNPKENYSSMDSKKLLLREYDSWMKLYICRSIYISIPSRKQGPQTNRIEIVAVN